MSQKEIRLYDDSVIKLTIKQGLEKERYPVKIINGNGDAINYEEVSFNIFNFDEISSQTGSFSSGELAYTRDTNRLFIGNLSDKLNGNQQQTLGGVLTGNKYLGYIDSRNNNDETDTQPLPLSNISSTNKEELLLENSSYRSYEFVDANNKLIPTEDRKWPRLSYYNEEYDAYDGDIMYDVYRNAIILFDHNIVPGNIVPDTSPKHKTPLNARFEGQDVEDIEEKRVVKKFTEDMYGNGYVLLYNVIPDGETLTFEPRNFTEIGTSNYSQNVIKVNKVPSSAIIDALDGNIFTTNSNGLISFSVEFSDKLGELPSFTIDSPASYILINDGTNSIIQSDLSVSELREISESIANLDTALDTIEQDITTNKNDISILKADIVALKENINNTGEVDNLGSMVPSYTGIYNTDNPEGPDNMAVQNKTTYVFQPNITTEEVTFEDETTQENVTTTVEVFLGHYYLIIGATGTFTVTETISETVEEEGNEEENEDLPVETESKTVTFGHSDLSVTGLTAEIPVYTEIMIPVNGYSTMTINGSGIEKLIKVPTLIQ